MSTLKLVSPPPERAVLSEQEAADYLGVSLSTMRHWRYDSKDNKSQTGPRWVQLGGKRVGYAKAELDRWIEARTVKFPEEP